LQEYESALRLLGRIFGTLRDTPQFNGEYRENRGEESSPSGGLALKQLFPNVSSDALTVSAIAFMFAGRCCAVLWLDSGHYWLLFGSIVLVFVAYRLAILSN
jgi:hypothetical protein